MYISIHKIVCSVELISPDMKGVSEFPLNAGNNFHTKPCIDKPGGTASRSGLACGTTEYVSSIGVSETFTGLAMRGLASTSSKGMALM